jgi:hypothetical protein
MTLPNDADGRRLPIRPYAARDGGFVPVPLPAAASAAGAESGPR